MKMVEDDFNESSLFGSPQVTGSNPLSGYFRLPGLSITLPTNGAYMPTGTIEFDSNGELEVLPMRAADELLLASPDALMNNSAITKLVESCIPQIKRGDLVSAPDLDVILLAIRVASSGPTMEIDLECPKCKQNTGFEINLPEVLNTAKTIPDTNVVRLHNDLLVYLKPHSVDIQSKILVSAFKETRMAQALDANPDLTDEERGRAMSEIMGRLSEINIFGLSSSIIKIVTPTAEVRDQKFINEFINGTDARSTAKIRESLEDINNMGVDKTINAVCGHCKHKWTSAIEFNPATFFEERSSD